MEKECQISTTVVDIIEITTLLAGLLAYGG